MGVFSRLSDIVNSNINAMLDRAEDPQKIIRLIVQEMEDTLVEVRATAARSIAEKKELLRKVEQLEQAEAEWQRKAELAVARNRDDLAKGALVARSQAAETARVLRQELTAIDDSLAKTNDDMAKLQAKLSEAKNKQRTMDIRRRAAGDQIRMRRQLHDTRIDDALKRYESMERRLDAMEAEVDSYDLGRRRGLADEFASLEAEDAVEQELQEMKARLAGRP
jgi:phage shock protein A